MPQVPLHWRIIQFAKYVLLNHHGFTHFITCVTHFIMCVTHFIMCLLISSRVLLISSCVYSFHHVCYSFHHVFTHFITCVTHFIMCLLISSGVYSFHHVFTHFIMCLLISSRDTQLPRVSRDITCFSGYHVFLGISRVSRDITCFSGYHVIYSVRHVTYIYSNPHVVLKSARIFSLSPGQELSAERAWFHPRNRRSYNKLTVLRELVRACLTEVERRCTVSRLDMQWCCARVHTNPNSFIIIYSFVGVLLLFQISKNLGLPDPEVRWPNTDAHAQDKQCSRVWRYEVGVWLIPG